MGTAPDRDYEEPKEYFASYDVPLYVRLLDFFWLLVGGTGLAFFCFGALCLVAGCSSLQQDVNSCFQYGGSPSYTTSMQGMTQFNCPVAHK